MDVCKRCGSTCVITAQKYGEYHYCSKCVSGTTINKIKNKLKSLIYSRLLTNMCNKCKKNVLKNNAVIQYNSSFNFSQIDTAEINITTKLYHAKCIKENLPPRITDELIDYLKIFDSANNNDEADIADDTASLKDQSVDGIIETKTTNPFDELEKNEFEEILQDRIKKLNDKLSKMNLVYLLHKVCADKELYNRLMAEEPQQRISNMLL